MKRHGNVKKPTKSDLEGRKRHPIAPALGAPPSSVNRAFSLTSDQRRYYDQGSSLECVAFSSSQLMTLLNGAVYDTGWLFWRAQEIDGVPGESGTTPDAVLRILRGRGHVLHDLAGIAPTADDPAAVPHREEGITEYRWFSSDPATALDEARSCIAQGMPFVMLSPWYRSFGSHSRDGGTWLDPVTDWGVPDGMWHQYLIDGAFDEGQYLTTPNSWGWAASQRLSYAGFKRLIGEKASCAAVTDYESAPKPPEPAPTPNPAFVCRYCGKDKKTKVKLKRHIQRRHRRR